MTQKIILHYRWF